MISSMDAPLQDQFRRGMRRQASSVCIITTIHDGERHGMTATAMSAVSAEPPSLLVCINRSASLHAPVRASERFAINLLSRDQVDLARRFSSAGDRELRFGSAQWRDSEGWAYLEDACASFLMTTEREIEHHSHAILIGQVRRVMVGPIDAPPLIYYDGNYASPSILDVR